MSLGLSTNPTVAMSSCMLSNKTEMTVYNMMKPLVQFYDCEM